MVSHPKVLGCRCFRTRSVTQTKLTLRLHLPPQNDALSRIQDSPPPDIHPDVMALSATFPFPWQVDATVRQQIRACLPKKEDALIICQQARLNALWQYVPLLNNWYRSTY